MIKIKYLIIGILINQLTSSCSEKFVTTEMKNNFSVEQTADLKKIKDFFESHVCNENESNFKECFEKIPHDSLYAYGKPFWKQINYNDQKKLYNDISKTTFSGIWTFCKTTYPKKDLILKSVCSSNSNYQKYLTDLGKNNPKIKKYAEKLLSAGDWNSGNIYYQVLTDEKNFDLNDSNIQLVLSIHYLTLNDQEKRNEKWRGE